MKQNAFHTELDFFQGLAHELLTILNAFKIRHDLGADIESQTKLSRGTELDYNLYMDRSTYVNHVETTTYRTIYIKSILQHNLI